MELTQSQIQELYKFTRKHYVEHYDVQTELVDHLANDIEEIFKENLSLSFEEARDRSFKKFGVFGFMEVVEKKQSQMTKKYFKTILKFVKEWFQLPKIILTFILFFSFYAIQKYAFAYDFYIFLLATLFIVELFVVFKNKRKSKLDFNKTGKKWMFKDVLEFQGGANSLLLAFYFFHFFFADSTNEFVAMGSFQRVFSAMFITIVLLLGYITLVIIPKKAAELLKETYPEYKIV